ncbi:MAG: hypothetical protein IMY72_04335 [Bacteroidetes bacterium]|nr:hypothetical protein [Bacteroidota bacterium]
MKRIIYFFILFTITTSVSAQEINTLYFMRSIPQSNALNPAIQRNCRVFIGLPALSSMYFDFSTGIAYNDFLTKNNVTNKYDYDIDKLITRLDSKNYFSSSVNINLFSLGLKFKNNLSFTLDVSEKVFARAGIPRDLIKFAWQGNSQFVGKQANFDNFNVDLDYYHELALGVSKKIGQVTVGAKGKVLLGIGNITSKKTELRMTSDPSDFDLTINSDIQINTSGPFAITQKPDSSLNTPEFDENKSVTDIFLNRENMGFALDAGIVYDINDFVSLSASVIDLGFINWKSDVNNISQTGSFTYSGPDANDTTNFFSGIVDSIKNSFKPDPITHDSYSSSLASKIYFGGAFNLNKNISFGVLSRGEIYNKKYSQGFTFSANTHFLKFLSTTVSYTMNDKGYNNFGLGLGLKGGPLQFYIVSDNIPVKPQELSYVNFRFGFNLLFGCKKKKDDTDSRSRNSLLWF